jgi:hypothetical protein
MQVPFEHTCDAQSVACTQVLPFAHGAHEPPQSTALSSPSFTPSLHDAAGAPASAGGSPQ